MADDDDRDLFGSDEDSEQEQTAARAAQPALPAAHDAEDAGPGPSPSRRDEEDLFGDSDDAGEQENGRRHAARTVVPPVEKEQFYCDHPPPDDLRLVRLTNILNVSTRPFDPNTYEEEQQVYRDADGRERVNLRHLNTVRWRWRTNEDGTLGRESNARFVKWSDGSWQLFLGDEALDVAEIPDNQQHHYLFVRRPEYMQGQARLLRKMQFRPATLTSKLHRQLRSAVDKRAERTSRVKATLTLVDPQAKTKEQADILAQREKARERLERSKQKARTRYTRGGGGFGGYGGSVRAAPMPKFNAGFLEAGDEFEDEEYDADAARAELSRGRRGYEEEEEAEAERRLVDAKRGAPQRVGRGAPAKRPRASRFDDDEDEELSDMEDEVAAGGEDEMAGFIVDDESDDELRRGKSSGGKGGRRGVLLDDEDDE